MDIISHRGFWQNEQEKNSLMAFQRSFTNQFGVETDVRDYKGELVISHDMAKGEEMTLEYFLTLNPSELLLALNIKADGLAIKLQQVFTATHNTNWFVFDMSIPDMLQHLKVGNPIFTRVSELEIMPICYSESKGIWLDAFYSEWYSLDLIKRFLKDGKRVCIVSPELHKRNHEVLWSKLRDSKLYKHDIILCTDYPDKANYFFE